MNLSRRDLFVGCSAAIAAMAGARINGLTFVGEDAPSDHPILVVVFLRGGIDGLNLLAPPGDKDYIAARPTHLRIAEDGEHKGLEMKGTDLRLHRLASPIKELYDDGKLAMIHACGLTHGTRSHFEAMDLIERGIARTEDMNLRTGWLARSMERLPDSSPIPALSLSGNMAASLVGMPDAGLMSSVEGLHLWGGDEQVKGLKFLYGAGNSWLHKEGSRAIETYDLVRARLGRKEDGSLPDYVPEHSAKYPDGELGNALRDLARMIKAGVGIQVGTVDFGGWDTHQDQMYQFNYRLGHLSESLMAFYSDLTSFHSRLNVVVMSEFGRRLKSNQSNGTDHGHGNVMMVMGPKVVGSKVHGRWPGLATEQLDARADLAVTTDYRNVLAEVMERGMGISGANKLFPGLESKPVGVLKT